MTVLGDFKEYLTAEWVQLFDNCTWIHYARRSRRKTPGEANKENSVGKTSRSKTATSTANSTSNLSCSTTTHKSTSSDFSVCESIDNDLLAKLAALPAGIDVNEWLATYVLSFFHHVNALYGAMAEFCTTDSCPTMCCPGFQQLPWVDEKGKKWKYSAPQYVDSVMSFCQQSSRSESLFPTKYGLHFSACFEWQSRKLIRLLWHCLGHLYLSHWEHLHLLRLRSQTAIVIAHLDVFARRFALLDGKDSSSLSQTSTVVRPVVVVVVEEDEATMASVQSSDDTEMITSVQTLAELTKPQ